MEAFHQEEAYQDSASYLEAQMVVLPLGYLQKQLAVTTGVDFGEARGQRHLGSDTEGGEICLVPSVFWQVIPLGNKKSEIPD